MSKNREFDSFEYRVQDSVAMDMKQDTSDAPIRVGILHKKQHPSIVAKVISGETGLDSLPHTIVSSSDESTDVNIDVLVYSSKKQVTPHPFEPSRKKFELTATLARFVVKDNPFGASLRDRLYDLYVTKQKSAAEIEREYDLDDLSELLHALNIPVRGVQDTLSLVWKDPDQRNKRNIFGQVWKDDEAKAALVASRSTEEAKKHKREGAIAGWEKRRKHQQEKALE